MALLREEVCRVNRLLPVQGLVTMHSGNASGYDPQSGRLVIKPSGVDYHALTPEMLVEVDLASGQVVAGDLRPSVDLPHHRFLYQHLPNLCGIIHTHSNFATAFAAVHSSVPLCLTAIADEFGGEIPCAPYVDNHDDNIGRAILRHRNQAPAILLANHGVFAWGTTPAAALKAAVMVEDVARTVHLAMQIGQIQLIPEHEARKWHSRYQTTYGQSSAAPATPATESAPAPSQRVPLPSPSTKRRDAA
ncbi:MAG: class II aldolase/adducin family protein [Planctomycetia bacterium]|nr:class II aldolase/adducin family protein [Planctomycetia bacterium]